MNEITIIIDEHNILHVYKGLNENIKVTILDENKKEDSEKIKELQYLFDKGLILDVINNKENIVSKLNSKQFPFLDENAVLLIRDQNHAKTDSGRNKQLIFTAFIDGYLSASAELSKCITKLFKSKNKNVSLIYNELEPLINKQDENYKLMCDYLNKSEEFDK